MNGEQNVSGEELRERFTQALRGQTDLSEYEVVYAWRDHFWRSGDNYALAFHHQQESLWTLNFRSGEIREVLMKSIGEIRESPSCRYQLIYRHSLKRESYYVPYLSAATNTHLHCVQLYAGAEFHLFCQKYKREPWLSRVWKN